VFDRQEEGCKVAPAAKTLLVLLFSAAPIPAVEEARAREEPQALGSRLVGHWSLVSIESITGDQTEYPFGRDAIGQLTYDAAGHMAVQIMNPNRVAFASGDQGDGTAEEVSTAFHGYAAYYGTYTVNEQSRVVTHRLVGSLFPNWVGTEQRREIVLEGDRLTLSTPPGIFGGKQRVFRAIWKRLE
jgi:Lipocalin-like domain